MNLFEYMRANTMEKEAPLAARLRPATLEEVVGQKHIIGKDKLLYRAIKADKISSVIFYGRNGQDDAGKGDRPYDERGIYPDQCHLCGEKGHGRGHRKSKGYDGHVWEEDDFVYR